MAKRNWVVFGATGKPNKALISHKSENFGGVAVHVCDLKGEHEYGDKYELSEVGSEYITMYFCKKESLHAFMTFLHDTLNAWDKFEEGVEDEFEEKRQ